MPRVINRTELQNGDTIYVHGYRGVVSNITYHEDPAGENTPHSDHGACIQRYNVTSDPNEEPARKLTGGYNGGSYGGCIINDPSVSID